MSDVVGADSARVFIDETYRHDPKDWTFWKSPGRHRHLTGRVL
jgi:hypothetical protein